MMFMERKRLAIAVAGVLSLGTSSVQAVDFGASTTMQSTLAVTVVNDFDISTVFATETAQNYVTTAAGSTQGVGAIVIAPDGTVTDPTDGDPALTSLGTPVPAQGSIDMVNGFTIELPDTSLIDEAQFVGNIGLTSIAANAIPLIHESANPAVPDLWMMHFRIEAVSGGTVAVTGGGDEDLGFYDVTPGFGETTFVFNIGATITTEPNDSGTAIPYQEGLYSGTFEVLAAY